MPPSRTPPLPGALPRPELGVELELECLQAFVKLVHEGINGLVLLLVHVLVLEVLLLILVRLDRDLRRGRALVLLEDLPLCPPPPRS